MHVLKTLATKLPDSSVTSHSIRPSVPVRNYLEPRIPDRLEVFRVKVERRETLVAVQGGRHR